MSMLSSIDWTALVSGAISILTLVLNILKARQAAGHAADAAAHATVASIAAGKAQQQ